MARHSLNGPVDSPALPLSVIEIHLSLPLYFIRWLTIHMLLFMYSFVSVCPVLHDAFSVHWLVHVVYIRFCLNVCRPFSLSRFLVLSTFPCRCFFLPGSHQPLLL